jgi:hypothetical protein
MGTSASSGTATAEPDFVSVAAGNDDGPPAPAVGVVMMMMMMMMVPSVLPFGCCRSALKQASRTLIQQPIPLLVATNGAFCHHTTG